MKLKNLILAGIAILWMAGPLQAQTAHVNADNKIPAHPRLMLLKGEEKTLMKQIKKDAYWQAIHNDILAESDRIIALPVSERIMEGRRLLGVSRENLRRIFFLSYAYRMTGEAKYAARAEQEMLKAASFSDWNPSHYLDVGEMTMALAIGYDWVYPRLSPASRETIKTAIIEKGLKPSLDPEQEKNNWWIVTDNNWGQVCHAGMTFGALAVHEDQSEMANKVINRAIDKITIPMEAYGPDGAYPEGIGYWGYGTSFNVMFLSAIEKAYNSDFGLSQTPGFLKTGTYSQQMITPALNAFCYSDNGMGAGFNNSVFWFYSKTQDPSLLYLQKRLYENDTKKGYLQGRLLPAVMIWGAGSDAPLANPVEPAQLAWMGKGPNPVAAFRTSWSDPNAIYLGFKTGAARVNHGHMDVGSFFMESDGVKWGMDLGSEDYNSLETKGVLIWGNQRWDVFRYNNFCHNVLTLNEKLHNPRGYATIEKYSDAPGLMLATSDLSEVYTGVAQNVKRGVALVDKRYVLIDDLVETIGQFTKVRWNMATMADKVTFLSPTTALLEKDGKKLYMLVEAPVGIRFGTWPTTSTYTYDSPNRGSQMVGFEADLPLRSATRIKVYLVPREQMSSFSVRSVLD